jgi:CYTH domain-containing protein
MHRYAKIERERRFLLGHFPADEHVVRVRRISDRYIDNTTLRLRKQSEEDYPVVFKLTQKIPKRTERAQQCLITSMYLPEERYSVLAMLSAKTLSKTRHSVPPFGIDIFKGRLSGLTLAEAEFESAADADALAIPAFISHEVTGVDRFTGGQLVCGAQEDVRAWLTEYGVGLARGHRP